MPGNSSVCLGAQCDRFGFLAPEQQRSRSADKYAEGTLKRRPRDIVRGLTSPQPHIRSGSYKSHPVSDTTQKDYSRANKSPNPKKRGRGLGDGAVSLSREEAARGSVSGGHRSYTGQPLDNNRIGSGAPTSCRRWTRASGLTFEHLSLYQSRLSSRSGSR